MTGSEQATASTEYVPTTLLVAVRSVYAPLDEQAIDNLGYSGSFMIPLPLFGGDRDDFDPTIERPLGIGGGITVVRGEAMQRAMEQEARRRQELRDHPENGLVFSPIVGYPDPRNAYLGIPRAVPNFLDSFHPHQITAIEVPGRLLGAQVDKGLPGIVKRLQGDFPDCITRVYPVDGQPLYPMTFSIPSPEKAQELMQRLKAEPRRYDTATSE